MDKGSSFNIYQSLPIENVYQSTPDLSNEQKWKAVLATLKELEVTGKTFADKFHK